MRKSIEIPSSVKEIGRSAFGLFDVPGLVIYGYKGSTAEYYANSQGILFEELKWKSYNRGVEDRIGTR